MESICNIKIGKFPTSSNTLPHLARARIAPSNQHGDRPRAPRVHLNKRYSHDPGSDYFVVNNVIVSSVRFILFPVCRCVDTVLHE